MSTSCTSRGDPLYKQLKQKYEDYEVVSLDIEGRDTIKQGYAIENEQGEELISFVVEEKGYEDIIRALVVIDTQDDVITEVEILEQNESKGYGEYVTEPWFLTRFQGIAIKYTIQVVKMKAENPNEIVAITGATITSKGLTNAVNECLEYYREMKGD